MALSPESSHRKLCLVLTCTEIQWRLGRRNRLLLRECDQEEVSGLIDRASSYVHCCLARGVRLVWEGAGDVCSSLLKSAAPRKPLRTDQQLPRQRPPGGLETPLRGLGLLYKHLSKGEKGGKKIKSLQAVKIKQNTKEKERKRKMAILYIFF